MRIMTTDTQFVEAVDKMHAFYTQAFSNLMSITFGIIAFVGVVLPIVVSLIQNRQLKRENDNLRRELKLEIETIASGEIENLEKLLDDKARAIDSRIEEKLMELNKKLSTSTAESRGSIFHLQGNSGVSNGDYGEATISYAVALSAYLLAKNLGDARVVANLLHSTCLPEIDKETFADSPRIKTFIEAAIKDLKASNQDGRHTDLIEKIERKTVAAEKREPSKNVQTP